MAKRKILHIGQCTGGVKTYVVHTFEYLNNEEYEFVMVAPAHSTFEAYCKEKHIKYYTVDLHRGFNPVAVLTGLIRIIRAIRIEKPDIIHTHSAKGGFLGRMAARLTGSKNIIYTPHAFSYLSFSGIKRAAFVSLELMAKNWTDQLLAISHTESAKAMIEIGFKKEKINTILNSIPIPKNIPAVSAAGAMKIRMIGRLTLQKNHFLFLEIAKETLKKYPTVEFSILGAGIHDELAEEINDYIVANGLLNKVKIEYWGDVEKSREFLAEADVFVMTSIFEGLPYSLLEAMSLGKPCVVSEVDGNKDVIRNYENGFSCITKTEFCEKIELLINNIELRHRLGLAGCNYVKKHHNIEINIHQLDRLYRKLTYPSSNEICYDSIIEESIPV